MNDVSLSAHFTVGGWFAPNKVLWGLLIAEEQPLFRSRTGYRLYRTRKSFSGPRKPLREPKTENFRPYSHIWSYEIPLNWNLGTVADLLLIRKSLLLEVACVTLWSASSRLLVWMFPPPSNAP